MTHGVAKLSSIVLIAATTATTAVAAPVDAAQALRGAIPTALESVRWGGWGGGWWWGAPAAGFVAGALIGGALAAPYYDYGYGPGPYYGYPAPAYAGGPGPDTTAYCAQRYRSYDPGSGTYLGYDGVRHPCP
jgi:BA14K-like protein